MTDRTFELNRRRVLGGIITLGGAAAAAGAGTFALFSDTEQSTDNTLSAGTLDLTVDGTDSAVTTVSVNDIAPGDSGSGATTLENTGNIDGYVDLQFSTATNNEGDNPESEGDTADPGDLGSVLTVTVDVGTTTVRSDTFNTVFDGTEEDASVPLNAGNTKDLTVSYDLPSSAGNDVQGDEAIGDITIELGQQTSQ